jgi:hypothetical protein
VQLHRKQAAADHPVISVGLLLLRAVAAARQPALEAAVSEAVGEVAAGNPSLVSFACCTSPSVYLPVALRCTASGFLHTASFFHGLCGNVNLLARCDGGGTFSQAVKYW